jgi:hypothetical protein
MKSGKMVVPKAKTLEINGSKGMKITARRSYGE